MPNVCVGVAGEPMRCAAITTTGAAMRQSEFDKLSSALDGAEFAMEEFAKKAG